MWLLLWQVGREGEEGVCGGGVAWHVGVWQVACGKCALRFEYKINK